ncbi:hypothetical protein [Streptomyces sp. Da 82-17]|uniref:LppU/SCO3897 family protein n=1 Tax=Streptomyces sp. Da 82-17 TaxID=3377116 RepID=UPI0038D4C131
MSVMQKLKIVGLALAVVFAGVIWFMSQNDSSEAEAGDCMKNKGTLSAPDLEIVDCGTAEAKYEVVKRIDDTLDMSRCEGVPGAEIPYQEQTSGSRRSSGQQFVLCLKEV